MRGLRGMKKSQLPPISEKIFTKQIVDLARWHGWLAFHPLTAMNKAGRYATFTQGDVGYPDLTMTRDGRLIFAELKAENGVTSVMQDDWLRRLRSCEALTTPVRVYLWRPSDWDEIEKVLK